MPNNPLAVHGLRCPEPECGGDMVCGEECGCPACWMPYDLAQYRPEAVEAWVSYGSILHKLNAEDVRWQWGWQRQYKSAPKYDIEIEFHDFASITITRTGARMYADLHEQVRAQTRETPAEWDCTASIEAHTLDELITWVVQTIHHVSEGK